MICIIESVDSSVIFSFFSLLFFFFYLFSCAISLLIQSRSEAALLHMPANYEHVVLGSRVTLSIDALVSTVNTKLCQHHGWVDLNVVTLQYVGLHVYFCKDISDSIFRKLV